MDNSAIIPTSTPTPLLKMAFTFLERVTTVTAPMTSPEREVGIEKEFLSIIGNEDATISALCFSFAGSVAEYDDLRQDALVNIWKGMDSFKGDSSLKTWVYRVVLNSCVSTIRKQSRFLRESESLDRLYNLVAEDSSADRDSIEELHRLISHLGSEDKAIILMWLDEATYDEISSVMGLPRNTVASRLRRVKAKLSRLASSQS